MLFLFITVELQLICTKNTTWNAILKFKIVYCKLETFYFKVHIKTYYYLNILHKYWALMMSEKINKLTYDFV